MSRQNEVRLDDSLLQQAKQVAKERDQSLTGLIEQGLGHVLARAHPRLKRRSVKLPVSQARDGTLPGVDRNNSADVLDRMEGIADLNAGSDRSIDESLNRAITQSPNDSITR